MLAVKARYVVSGRSWGLVPVAECRTYGTCGREMIRV